MKNFKYLVMCMALLVGLTLTANSAYAIPKSVQAKSEYMLADELFNQKDYKGAIEHAEKAKAILGKSNSRIEYMLTKAYYEGKNYGKAFTAIESFFELTPESESGSKQYGEMVGLYSKVEIAKKKNDAKPTRLETVRKVNAMIASSEMKIGERTNYGSPGYNFSKSVTEAINKLKEYGHKNITLFNSMIERLKELPPSYIVFSENDKSFVVNEVYLRNNNISNKCGLTISKTTFNIIEDGIIYHSLSKNNLTVRPKFKNTSRSETWDYCSEKPRFYETTGSRSYDYDDNYEINFFWAKDNRIVDPDLESGIRMILNGWYKKE